MKERSSSHIVENIKRIKEKIENAAIKAGRNPQDVLLMAVTKTVRAEDVNAAIECGITLIGENRAQELLEKYYSYNRENLDIQFIGHLQSNKIKQVIGKVSTIQSVDSFRKAAEIDRLSLASNTTTNLLIEVNVGGEDTKNGVDPEYVEDLSTEISKLGAVKLCGLMAIPPICDNPSRLEEYFSRMQSLKVDIKAKKIDNISMDILSMGMSDDYIYAIKHGSTIVRLGSAIFGSRNQA